MSDFLKKLDTCETFIIKFELEYRKSNDLLSL